MRRLGTIISWTFFGFFLFVALGAFVSGGILSGLLFIVLALLCSPLRKVFFNALPKGLYRIPLQIGLGFILFFLGFGLIPDSENKADNKAAVIQEETASANQVSERSNPALMAEQEERRLKAEEAALEAEKKVQEELAAKEAAEEAERKAQEEAERKAQEEAAAQEKQRQEAEAAAAEAERKAQEELAARQAAEEAERKAQEEAQRAAEFVVTQPAVVEEQSRSMPSTGGGGQGNAANFDLYDNPEQQRTSDTYVLNTSTKKIHFPTCRDVKKIAPENYATTSMPIGELEAQKYKRCGHCNPF